MAICSHCYGDGGCNGECVLKNREAQYGGPEDVFKVIAGSAAKKGVTLQRRVRKDMNHAPIVEALRRVGAVVIDMSNIGGGVPDIAVGFRGKWFVIEIKNPKNSYGKKGLSATQKEWSAQQHAPVHVAFNVEDALSIIGAVRRIAGQEVPAEQEATVHVVESAEQALQAIGVRPSNEAWRESL